MNPYKIPRFHFFAGVLWLASAQLIADPVDAERQSIRIAMLQEPPSLDSAHTTDLVSFFVLGHVNEGLLRYDRRGKLAPGVAVSWTVAASRLTFRLREDARWHDGSRVVAADFVYAWRRVNDPAEASPFAAIMRPIKHAAAIQQGKKPVHQLGVSAPDDHTLIVELERPCGYCLGLMTHTTFFPIQAAFHERVGGRFGADANLLLSNGPFMLTEWTHEARLVMTGNPHYWNRDAVTLNEIEVAYISSDNRARFNLFRDNQIAFVRLGAETAKDAAHQSLKVRTFLTGGVSYIWFNMRKGRSTANRHLRKAIQSAFDPDEYVNQVIAIPGYKPTETLFPAWLKGVEKPFIEEFPPPAVDHDLKHARRLLDKAGAELGALPRLSLLTVSSTTGVKAAEYVQGRLRKTLGLNVLIDRQTFKQYLSKARGGEFDLALSSWYPDFDDPVTYADLLGSYNPNNRGGFVSGDYDRWLKVLTGSMEPRARFEALAAMQKIIIEQAPLLPTAETGSVYLQHPRLRGVIRRVLGPDPDFTHASVAP